MNKTSSEKNNASTPIKIDPVIHVLLQHGPLDTFDVRRSVWTLQDITDHVCHLSKLPLKPLAYIFSMKYIGILI